MMKRLFASLNLALLLLLLGVLFILVNYLSSRHYMRKEMTAQHFTEMSEQTKKVLASLEKPVEVIVFYDPGHALYEPVRDLLKEYAKLSPKLKVEYLDPAQDPARAQMVVNELKIDSANLVIFKSEGKVKHLPETELAEYDYEAMQLGQPPRLKAFKAEEAFTSAILNVTQSVSPRIWVVSGHGEKELAGTDPVGLAEMKKTLEQQNMAPESVTLLDKSEIPADVKLVILAGPSHRLTDNELSLLDHYLAEAGGRLLAMIDPLTDTGLEPLLSKWGVTLGNDVVVDPARQLPFVSPANLFVVTYQHHPIVERMRTLATLFPLARSVRPAAPPSENAAVSVLAETSEKGWGETKLDSEEFTFNEGVDTQAPVSIAVAVEAKNEPKTRLVVIGDSDFATNGQIASAGNRDLLSGTVHWLADQDALIGIGSKTIHTVKLQLIESQVRTLMWFSLTALPLFFLGMGAATWWLRRT